MVLPPPALDVEEGARVAAERLLRLLRLGHEGTLLLAVGGNAWVGRLWRVLLAQPGGVFAAPEPRALDGAPRGACVLYQMQAEDAEWLNVHRPLFEERGLRVVILATPEARRAVRRHAKDFYDWISHTVLLPNVPFLHTVQSLRVGMAEGVSWQGPGLAEALPWVTSAPTREIEADLPWDRWREEQKTTELLLVRNVRSDETAGWVVRASGGRGGMVYVDGAAGPVIRVPEWTWREAAGRAAAAGAAAVAARLDLEREALAVVDGGALDAATPDPAVALARRLGHRGGVVGMRAFPPVARLIIEHEPREPEDVQLLIGTGRTAEAAKIAQDAVERMPGEEGLAWRLVLAEVLAGLGRFEEALTHGDRALALARVRWAREPNRTSYLNDLAVGLATAGTIYQARGDNVAAGASFEGALSIERRLLAREPWRLHWLSEIGVACSALGRVHLSTGDIASAKTYFDEALAVSRRLVEGDPDRLDWLRELAFTCHQLGDFHHEVGNGAGARLLWEEACAISRNLVANESGRLDWLHDLYVSCVKLNNLHVRLGNLETAKSYAEEALGIARQLTAREPARLDWRCTLSEACGALGRRFRRLANLKAAEYLFMESLQVARQLVAHEPSRSAWVWQLSAACIDLGELRRTIGENGQAWELFAEALAIRRQLVARDPERMDWLRDLAGSLERLATVDPGGPWLSEALGARRRVVQRLPLQNAAIRELAISLYRLGVSLLPDAEAARPFFIESLAILESLHSRGALEPRFVPTLEHLRAAFPQPPPSQKTNESAG